MPWSPEERYRWLHSRLIWLEEAICANVSEAHALQEEYDRLSAEMQEVFGFVRMVKSN